MFFCPDGIPPNSGLTGPNNTIYIYIYIYIEVRLSVFIIIMSCHQHGYPWPSLATSPYHSSPPAGLQSYILYLHIVAVCKFALVVLLLLCHMWGSISVLLECKIRVHCYGKQQTFLNTTNRSIWPIDKMWTDTITLGQSGPESNDNEGVTPHSLELQNWVQFCIISRIPYFFGGEGVLILLQKMQSANWKLNLKVFNKSWVENHMFES